MKTIKFYFLVCVALISASCIAAEKTILVVESYHAEYPWDVSYIQGIKNILGREYRLVFFQMDTKRLPAELFEKKAQEAFEMYLKINPVLVMLGDDDALKYLGPKLAKTATPVVYLGINNNPRNYDIKDGENMTGVLERPLMKRSIMYLNSILQKPRLEKLLILFDSGTTSEASVLALFQGQTSLVVGGVQVDLKQIGHLADWKAAVLSAKEKGYGAIIVGLYQTISDENGKHVKDSEILDWTSKNTPVPPFGFWDFSVGENMTCGGLVLFGQTQGEEAAKIVQQIFSGKSPQQIQPVMAQKGRFLFSRSQLEKWQIKLPESIAAIAEFTR